MDYNKINKMKVNYTNEELERILIWVVTGKVPGRKDWLINLREYFSDKDIQTLKKLNIKIEDKIYDRQEYKKLENKIMKSIEFSNNKTAEKLYKRENINYKEYISVMDAILEIYEDFGVCA